MTQTPQTMTPGRAAFGRLFPAMTMTAAKAEARALDVTIRLDPLGPCQDGGRLIEVFPLGCGSSAVSAYDPAEALFWARCFYEDSKASRIGWAGPSKDSQVRVMVMAALDARGFGLSGVSLSLTLTAGPTASADCVATVDGPAGVISARFHEFTSRGALAMAAEDMADSLSGKFLDDAKGLSLSALDPDSRARFWRLESVYLSAIGVNEATAEAARKAEAFADWSRSSGPSCYRVAALGFRHAAALFQLAKGQTGGHAKRARYQEAADSMTRKADSAEVDSWPHATPEAAEIDPAEGLGFGVETVTESGPVVISAGVMEPEPTPEAFPTVRHAAEARARYIDVTPTWAALVPAFRAVLENGTPEGVAMVWAELARMAQAADSAVASEARAKAEERAQIEAARAAEAEAVAALSDIMAPRPCHYSQEAESILDAGAVARAERASVAAEPLTREGQAPEAQNAAQRAQNAAGAVMELAGARSAVRAAKRAAQPPASGFSLAHEFGPRHWQGKAAEGFRKAAAFAQGAGLSDPAAILTHAAEVAADKAEGFDGMAQTRAV